MIGGLIDKHYGTLAERAMVRHCICFVCSAAFVFKPQPFLVDLQNVAPMELPVWTAETIAAFECAPSCPWKATAILLLPEPSMYSFHRLSLHLCLYSTAFHRLSLHLCLAASRTCCVRSAPARGFVVDCCARRPCRRKSIHRLSSMPFTAFP